MKLVTVHDDGTPPTYSDANLVNNIGTLRSVDLIPDNLNWETGQQYNIALSVLSESQKQSEWSMPVPIAVADPLECSVTSTSFDTKNLYSITTDTEINEAQTYYTLVGTEVQDPVIDDILTYYELADGVYTRTEDGVIDTEKTYYTVVGTVVQDPQEESLSEYYICVTYNILKQMPITLSASVTGGLENKFYTNVSIERAAPYFVDRPDETTYSGYEGETVYSDIVGNPASITITQNDLAGYLDDSALYYLNVYAFDDLDQVSAAEPILFMVEWEHQAPVPTAVAEFDPEYSVVKITPSIDPEKYEEGDTFDIYRLSIDKPVLIVKGGTYDSNGVGQTYVDPYPTIGESGGHRVVTVTANGDFIANDEETDMAWVDLDADDGDIFRHDFSIINSGEGRFEILYNADLSTNWQKDFKETKYLGGHIQGDWNAGIHRDSTINSVVLRNDDIETETAFRRLAEYPGICHVRTLDGSNYYADVQVNESIPYDDTPTTSYSFKITRVDSEGYDGIELSEWNKLISG